MVKKLDSQKKARPNLYNKIHDNSDSNKNSKLRKKIYTRSNKLYQGFGKISNYYKIFMSILVAIGIFYIGAYGMLYSYNFIKNTNIFAIKAINIVGNVHLTEDEILTIIDLETGKNIFDVEIQSIRKELLADSWVNEVTIRRALPATINIEVMERRPVFWAIKDDILYYIDNKAELISPVTHDKFISLPMLHIKNANYKIVEILPKIITVLSNKDLTFSLEKLSWVKINASNDLELYHEQTNKTFIIDMNDWKRNIEHLQLTIDDLKKRNEFRRIRTFHAAKNQVNIIK